jgi:hypothetical protein
MGRPMSVDDSTSVARPARPWPICCANMALPAWFSIPMSGPAMARASSGMACAIAPTTLSAMGSMRRRHEVPVASTHSARLHATDDVVAAGTSVTRSSHVSASRTASATAPT